MRRYGSMRQERRSLFVYNALQNLVSPGFCLIEANHYPLFRPGTFNRTAPYE